MSALEQLAYHLAEAARVAAELAAEERGEASAALPAAPPRPQSAQRRQGKRAPALPAIDTVTRQAGAAALRASGVQVALPGRPHK